jgi:hypothetical protein
MRKSLLAFLLLALTAAPALAVDFDGGELIVTGEFPAGYSGTTGTAAITPAYGNVLNFLGQAYAPASAANQAGNLITRLTADDLTPNPIYGGLDVVSFSFVLVNLNSTAVSFRPRARFWFADGAGGNPGTYYNVPAAVGFSFAAVNMAANTATVFTGNVAAGVFTMPGVTFWAGMTFDNNTGATGATAAQLNNIGMGIFDPPTNGSSTDKMFVTAAAGSFFAPNNPAGASFNFGGNPIANAGWAFNVDNATPAQTSSWGRLKQLYR